MTDEQSALQKLIDADLAFCAAMTAEIEDYLRSKVLFWEPRRNQPGRAALPKLTLGGLLLALRRLETLPDAPNSNQTARQSLAAQKSQWQLRYTRKLAQEVNSRLNTWAWFLSDCAGWNEDCIAHYAYQVGVRVKLDLLLAELSECGAEPTKKNERLASLDASLQVHFKPGDFIWPTRLAAGFPAERFWYVWGRPAGYSS